MADKPSSDLKLEMEMTTVFKSNKKEDRVYRIPALVYDADEKILLSFAEKRRTEDDAHSSAVVMKRGTVKKDGSTVTVTFEEPEVELLKKTHCGPRPMNPCPVYEKHSNTSRTLFLFFIFVKDEVKEQQQIQNYNNKAHLCYIKSTDAGKSWSEVFHVSEYLEQMKNWATFAVGPGHAQNKTEDQRPKWLLYSHPTHKCRKDLGVYLNESPPDPSKWSKPWIINPGPSGYSDLVYMGDGWFACLMERGEKIETEQIDLKVEVPAEASVQLSKGYTMTEEISNSISVELKVPPNHQYKMKLSSSLLLLLVVSADSLQNILQRSSWHKNVSPLTPDLEETAERSTLTHRHILSPAKVKQKRQTETSSSALNNILKWQTWNGSLPNGSVSIDNGYAKRIDYVCQHHCIAGFYNPDMGPYCNYPYGDKEYKAASFKILVNEDDFENLEWKDDSYGSVPPSSVKTCHNNDIYVGKNKYGLGKVHRKHKAFFLPWEGSEYWYKYYQVLTINTDIQSEDVSDIKYNTNGAEIITYPPENMHISTMSNYECDPVRMSTILSKMIRVEKRWDISSSITFGLTKTIKAGVPFVADGSIEISTALSFQFSGGHTNTEEINLSTSVDFTVPPNHSCKARMVGHKYKVNVPFTARLSRTYRNGVTTWTSVSGTYDGVQVGEVHSEVDRCKPVPDAQSC
ncbi:hypothetical protein Q5P01_015354 [Channa striata]|uniref:Exo-alpha-sialidase n=1 Tax=Channa striata TaxID=64152 RepID=A0AA88MKH6_CHASR|nr:hypothetical protein Q5P01_015354 [Channa striata]